MMMQVDRFILNKPVLIATRSMLSYIDYENRLVTYPNNLQFTGWHVTPLGRIIFQVNQSVILFLNAVQQIPIWNIPATFAVKWFGDLRY
jgi:hypothetical protein